MKATHNLTEHDDLAGWNEKSGNTSANHTGRLKRAARAIGVALGIGGVLGAGVATGVMQGVGHDVAAVSRHIGKDFSAEAAPKLIKTEQSKASIFNGTLLLEPNTPFELVAGPASRYSLQVGGIVTAPTLVERPLIETDDGITTFLFRPPVGGVGIKEVTEEGTIQGVNSEFLDNNDTMSLSAANMGTVHTYMTPNADGDPAANIYPITEFVSSFSDGTKSVDYGTSEQITKISGGSTDVYFEAVPVPDGISTEAFVAEQNQVLGTTYEVPGW